jgi:hypothetical protein
LVRADRRAHDYARVRFYRPPPGVGLSENFEFHAGKRYAVIARRIHDGTSGSMDIAVSRR